jgi:hypothetical protein
MTTTLVCFNLKISMIFFKMTPCSASLHLAWLMIDVSEGTGHGILLHRSKQVSDLCSDVFDCMGCASPLDGNSGKDDPCPVLQQQVQPLEDALEKLGAGNTSFVFIGDFNRNMWHEAIEVVGAKADCNHRTIRNLLLI